MSRTHPFLVRADGLAGPLAFAHRGGAAVGDENTIEAFGRAIALGYRHLETDVHATADGVAIIFHDKTTDRMLGRPGRIDDVRWSDLATVRVAGTAAVPRLDDLLDAWPEAFLNIDLKSHAVVDPTIVAIRAAGAQSRVLLASFDDDRLARVRRALGPQVATSLGQRAAGRLWAASRFGAARFGAARFGAARFGAGGRSVGVGAVAAQMPHRMGRIRVTDRRFIRYAHRVGLAVHVWTVDNADDIRDLLDAGVDGIMTDHIDVLRDVYTERGLWPA